MNKEVITDSARSAAEKITVMLPEGWSSRELTKWFSQLELQSHATFVLRSELVRPILDFQEAFYARFSEIFSRVNINEQIPSILFARMASVQSAASRLLFAGQIYEAQALMRSALECGVYACAVHASDTLRNAWVHRGDGIAAKERCRRAFGWNRLLGTVDGSARGLRALIAPVYERLIDFGAHPNAAGIGAGVRFGRSATGERTIQTILSGALPGDLEVAARQQVEVLHIGFELVRQTMPVRVEKAGVISDVEKILQSVGIQLLPAPKI